MGRKGSQWEQSVALGKVLLGPVIHVGVTSTFISSLNLNIVARWGEYLGEALPAYIVTPCL